jgi:D-threo-aldose 1-dehydrogenase
MQKGGGQATVEQTAQDLPSRRVGRTALHLPVMGFGAAHLGELYGLVREEDSRATLQGAWDHGIRYYDTAPWYGRGLSEHRLGGFLRTLPRSQFQVTTKVGRTLHRPTDPATFSRAPWTGGLNFEVHFDYSRDGVMRSYEQALQRLALDTVDALIIHDLEAMFHGDATEGYIRQLTDGGGIAALEELKRAGDIQAFGMGTNTDDALDNVVTRVDVDFLIVAMPYTLLDQRALHHGMARCVEKGMGVIIGAPFASGILVTGSGAGATYGYAKAAPEVQAKVRGIEMVAAAYGVSLPAAALQFVLAHPAVASVIPGAARVTEVAANVAALRAPIPAEFWAALKTERLILADAPVPA